MSIFDISGSKVLVTGATSGIGEAIVSDFVRCGACVVASGSKEDVLSQKYGNTNVMTIRCDLRDIGSVPGVVTSAYDMMGGLDVVVCCAGITKDKLVMRMKQEEWDNVIGVNLDATFALNQAAIKCMLKQRYGRIINITSVIGATGNVGQANYAASKGGVASMSKSIAYEVASHGITVNCVAPGFIETPMTDVLSDQIKETIRQKIPIGKFGKPEDVAYCVLFLACRKSWYITASTIHVNGGLYAS